MSPVIRLGNEAPYVSDNNKLPANTRPSDRESESLLIPADVFFRKALYSSKYVYSGWIRGVCIHVCVYAGTRLCVCVCM